MEKFEALWAYQEEDMKADAIAAAIKRSPTRQKLEKARDFILDRQKQYKQIEEDVGAMVDRKDIIAQAIARSREQLQALQKKYESNPPQTAEEIKALLSEVSRCRDTIRQYEVEISRIVKETDSNDKLSRSVRLEAANAKKTFDQLKSDYEEESKSKKGELEAQRAKAKELMDQVDPKLLEEYETIKKHISPPVARLTHGQCITAVKTSPRKSGDLFFAFRFIVRFQLRWGTDQTPGRR